MTIDTMATWHQVTKDRDVKGLYKKARAGEIIHMTGVSDPYEAPENPALEIVTDNQSIAESVKIITKFLENKIKPSIYE